MPYVSFDTPTRLIAISHLVTHPKGSNLRPHTYTISFDSN